MNSSGRFSGDLTPLGVKIDASGGWWDAGDYLKFVETISYTVDMMQFGVREFPDQLGTGSTTANFTTEAKFGLDSLRHIWDDSTKTLYYQVGIGSGNAKTLEITISGACRRRTTTMAGPRCTATSVTARCFALAPPDRSSAPILPGAWRPTSRSVSRSLSPATRPTRPMPALGRAHFRPGEHQPQWQFAHSRPLQLLS